MQGRPWGHRLAGPDRGAAGRRNEPQVIIGHDSVSAGHTKLRQRNRQLRHGGLKYCYTEVINLDVM